MKDEANTVTLGVGHDEIAPVRILDAEGRLIRVVPAAEFRRARPAATGRTSPVLGPRRKGLPISRSEATGGGS